MAWAITEDGGIVIDTDGVELLPGRIIEVTITAKEGFEGAGFLGVGWRARTMNGADIWFCRVNGFLRDYDSHFESRIAVGPGRIGVRLLVSKWHMGSHGTSAQRRPRWC